MGFVSADVRGLRAEIEHLRFCIKEITSLPVDLESLVPGDLRVRLRSDEVCLLGTLLSVRGRKMSHDALLAAICGLRPTIDWPEIKIISIYVSRIRRAIRETGAPIRIETVWGFGYRALPLRKPTPVIDITALDPC